MLSLGHELKASYAFIERNFFLTRRYWGWELAFLVYSVAGALSISLIGEREQRDPCDDQPEFVFHSNGGEVRIRRTWTRRPYFAGTYRTSSATSAPPLGAPAKRT